MTEMKFEGPGAGPVYTGVDIWLPLLQHEHFLAGGAIIEDRKFIDCRLHGPAVLLPISGCDFDACNLGNAYGDITNLMYKPMGPTKLVGAIAFRNCTFQRCDFIAVAYTGAEDFLKSFRAIGTTTQ